MLFLCDVLGPQPSSCYVIGPGPPSASGDNRGETPDFGRRVGHGDSPKMATQTVINIHGMEPPTLGLFLSAVGKGWSLDVSDNGI